MIGLEDRQEIARDIDAACNAVLVANGLSDECGLGARSCTAAALRFPARGEEQVDRTGAACDPL